MCIYYSTKLRLWYIVKKIRIFFFLKKKIKNNKVLWEHFWKIDWEDSETKLWFLKKKKKHTKWYNDLYALCTKS